ncbi:hypothetical protein FKM82_020193 [Ascaphus truei]
MMWELLVTKGETRADNTSFSIPPVTYCKKNSNMEAHPLSNVRYSVCILTLIFLSRTLVSVPISLLVFCITASYRINVRLRIRLPNPPPGCLVILPLNCV